MKRWCLLITAAVLLLGLTACGGQDAQGAALGVREPVGTVENSSAGESENRNAEIHFERVIATTTVAELLEHPAFTGFARYLLPLKNRSSYDGDMRLDNIDALLPYHGHIQTATTLDVLNYLIGQAEAGETTFYEIYDAQQIEASPAKEDTGLFFFPGEPGAPFAMICAGGGFSYVGSIHESFPHALELSRLGYNAFALEYRVGSEQAASEDLAAAISFIFEHAAELEVSVEGYSLWGGSAGARMAGNLGSYGVAAFGGAELPGPGMVVIAYTGHSGFTANDPPTFTMVSENDRIVNAATVERRVANMRNAGVEVEYHKYQSAGHGFGLGIGTDAEGWLYNAARFWQTYLPQEWRLLDLD